MLIEETSKRLEDMRHLVITISQSAHTISDLVSQYKLPPIPMRERIEECKRNLGIVPLTTVQRSIVQELIKELSSDLPVHDFVIAGAIRRAMKRWQLIHKTPVISVAFNARDEQLAVGCEILEYLQEFLERGTYIPDKEKKTQFFNHIFKKLGRLLEELISAADFMAHPQNQAILYESDLISWI